MPTNAIERYNNVAIILHWLIGLAIIGMVISGFAMDWIEMESATKGKIMGLHKSTGLLLLFFVAFRIMWRFISRKPSFPSVMKAWEIMTAKVGHISLYIMMVAMPLSGYLMSSAGKYPLNLYGLVDFPKLNLSNMIMNIGGFMHEIHIIGAWVISVLVIGHIAAVFYHRVVDKLNILPRMWFGKSK